MGIKRFVFSLLTAVAAFVPAGAASADIVIGFPPSPIAPPPTEDVYLVRQSAPVNVWIVFLPDPGPPEVYIPDPGPPEVYIPDPGPPD
jgi:hypothetical protein